MRYAISYVSTKKEHLPEEEINEILTHTEKNNNKLEITGILLYSEGNFFQVLEGPREDLQTLYTKIKLDSGHYDLISIFEKEVDEPIFQKYTSEFTSIDTRYKSKEVEAYLTKIKTLSPAVQSSVKYILKNFLEGI